MIGLLSLPALVAATAPDSRDGVEVSALVVNRVNIFPRENAAANPASRLINRLHYTTRRETIVRELGVSMGDKLNSDDIAVLERNLRALNLFASVSVQMRTNDNATGTVVVNTRDRFSLVGSADGSFVGGVGEVGIVVGENNLRGLGDSVTLSLRRNTADNVTGMVSFNDLHFGASDRTAQYRFGATEEGDFAQVVFSQPFKTATDRSAWSTKFERVEHEIDYYEGGRSVAQIPEMRFVFNAQWLRRLYTGNRADRRGWFFQFGDHAYESVQGSQANSYAQPSDNTQLLLSTILGREAQTSHREATGFDTLQFVQDLNFGFYRELRLGARVKRRDSGITHLTPVVSGSFSGSRVVADDTYGKLSLRLAAEAFDDGLETTATVGLKLYRRLSTSAVLAARVDYSHAENTTVIPTQYTLGESNGLRGYANRLLSGDQMLRLNLEHRVDLQRRVGFLDVGLIGFVDAGWVAPEPDSLKRAVGVGLRLGSNALLGRSVFRMDVAFPLDGDETDPVFSAALGQVFTF
jgi:hemolysin activation/secretion protein